jgi:Ca2+-binding RTX toxin-like protein
MATMISPGQYRLSLLNETLTSATSWNTLVGTSSNQVLKLMSLYYGVSGKVDMGGGIDTLIINTNAKARLDLRNTEFVYASEGKSVSLQLMNVIGSTFTTDGTIKEIIGGGGKEHVTFEHGLANAGTRPNGNSIVTVSLGGGISDLVTFEQATRVVNLPGGGSYVQNAWVIYATSTGYAAYNNFRDYTVNVLGNVEQINYNGDTYIKGNTNLTISNIKFDWTSNSASTDFIVNVPSVSVYFRTGGSNSFLDNNAVFTTSNNTGIAQQALISQRAVAAEGVLRVEAGTSYDESSEHLFIGTAGNDNLTASTINPTAIYGFAGNDILAGNVGADTIYGGIGNDVITAGVSDIAYGNEGEDNFIGFANATTLIDGGTGNNTLVVNSNTAIAGLAGASNAALVNVQTVTAANASGGVSINLASQTEGFTIIGSAESDVITASQGSDIITSNGRTDTITFGSNGSLVATMDTITDYQGEILDFAGNAALVGAGGSTLAGLGVTTSATGKVSFDAADDTLAEKIAAVRNDSSLDAPNSVAVFSDGSDAYVYYAGSTVGNADDQIVKLAGAGNLDRLTIDGSGNVSLDREPPSTGLTTVTSLVPTQSSWNTPGSSAVPTGFTPGNDGNSNTSQGDGVNGNTNQLIRNASGNFGTHVTGGDDTFGEVAIPTGLWSTGLNMFGTVYDKLYIGTNGYVTFGSGYYGYVPSGIAGFTQSPMIAAQFDDLYTDAGARYITEGAGAGTSQNSHNMYYFSDANKIVFTWDNVGLYAPVSSSNAGNKGSAFQIIIHKPNGENVASQNFGMEIRYEEVTQQYNDATAGWTAGDTLNYGLINTGNTVLSTIANSSSNVGINGVWAWEVNGGVVSAPYFVPDIGINTPVDIAAFTFRNALPTGFTISGDGDGYGFTMTAATANGSNSTSTLKTISNPVWNLWKEQYKDGEANLIVTPTGHANAVAKSIDIKIFNNGLDSVTRVGGAAGTSLSVSATSIALNTASNSDISTITTVTATASSSINLSNQTEAFTMNGSAGTDTLVGGSANDTISGAGGNDTLTGGSGSDQFNVTSGTDSITDLGAGGDAVSISAGATLNATVNAHWSAGTASLNAGTANINANGYMVNLSNVTTTGANGWSITNSGGSTTITGSPQNDSITGGSSADILQGNQGDDLVTGGAGNDYIIVDNGIDTFTDLGNGADAFVVQTGATMNATLAGNWVASSSSQNNGIASIDVAGHTLNLTNVSSGAFTVTNSSGSGASIIGSNQNDTITGGSGNDTIKGGLGNDIIISGQGLDDIDFAGAAATKIIYTGSGVQPHDGTSDTLARPGANGGGSDLGSDTLVNFTLGTDIIHLNLTQIHEFNPANQVVMGLAIPSFAGAQSAYATNVGLIDLDKNGYYGEFAVNFTTPVGTLNANSFRDSLQFNITGGNGDDTLGGWNKNDTINGGAGTDTITLGDGVDTVIIQSVDSGRIDNITGFGTNDIIGFATVTSYAVDNRDLSASASLADATTQVATLRGTAKATGFSYGGLNYVLINTGADSYDADVDAVVQLIGTDLSSLSNTNFA